MTAWMMWAESFWAVVASQCTNVTDRQTTGQDRHRTDNIGQTVLQTVAQKLSAAEL